MSVGEIEDVPVTRRTGRQPSEYSEQIARKIAQLKHGQSFVVPESAARIAVANVCRFNQISGGFIHTRTQADGSVRVGCIVELRIIGDAPWLLGLDG